MDRTTSTRVALFSVELKKGLKVIQNRNRVNLHRRMRTILEHENRSMNGVIGQQNPNDSNQVRQNHDNIASIERLRRWATEFNISKRAISELLKILFALGLHWLWAYISNGKLW